MTQIGNAAPAGLALPVRYQLLQTLKDSSTTTVYRVFDVTDQREKAMKILRFEMSEQDELLRFETEFKTLGQLDHAAVIDVHEFGLLDEGYPYFTMEFFAGRRITEYFNGNNWQALYHVLIQIVAGLHHIHHLGIVHLDLKPSNIMISDDGRVKIMDFGLAAEGQQLFDRKIRGTLQYMAPEVLRQDRVDLRADLYALGMTIYETVTGALPTYGKPAMDVIRFHLDDEVKRPSAINPNVPLELETIILRLLEKDPRDRYPSAALLLHDLAQNAGVRLSTSELLVGSGELLAAPLIGRSREIDEIAQHISEAREGRGGGLIVAAPEGMGKSRVVREATLRAQIDGARIFCGRCPVNRKTIYAPFFEIFQQMLRSVNPDADPAAEIRRIVRTVASGGVDGRSGKSQKVRLFTRILQSIQDFYGLLNAMGESGSPLILVIEDLQWADKSTAELFSFLIGDARRTNLLLIGTLTTDESNEFAKGPGHDWQQRAKETSVPLLHINPLSDESVQEYVESLLGQRNLPHEFVRWILWESGGSPLNIRRIIEHLVQSRMVFSTVDGWSADMEQIHALRIPGGAASLSVDSLDHLAERERTVLQVGAVLGESFDLNTIAKISSLAPEDTYAALRELVAANILDQSGDGRSFAFPQVSYRETVYASVPERDRASLHARVAAVLEERFEDGAYELLGQVAYHYSRANDYAKGIEHSIRAGEHASSALAHEQAAEFYRSALELMDLSGSEARRSEIREKLGDSFYRAANFRGAMQIYQFLLKSLQSRTDDESSSAEIAIILKKIGKVLTQRGEFDAALSYFHRAHQIFKRAGSTLDVAEMLNRIAWTAKEKGDLPEAEASALEAAALIENEPISPIHGYVKNTQGVIAYGRGDWAASRVLFEQACSIAEILVSSHLRKVTTTNLGNVMWKMGKWDEALQYFRRNLEHAESEGDLWDLVGAYNNVALIEYSRGNFHLAADLFEKSARIDDKLGSPENQATALENLGEALEMIGRWQEAGQRYERCLALEGFDEQRSTRASVYVPLARLTAKVGDMALALQYGQKAFDAAQRSRDEDAFAEACFVLAHIEKERENLDVADDYLRQAMDIFLAKGTVHGESRARLLAAEIQFRRQRIEPALEHLAQAEAIAGSLGDRFTLARCSWVRGNVEFLRSDRGAAEKLFENALAVFEELQTPYEQGRLLFDLGLMRDDPDEASQAIRKAIKIFERLEAGPDLERARGALFKIKPVGKNPESNVVGLYEVVKIINSTLHLEDVLDRVIDLAIKRLRAERGMLILLDPITSALRTRVVRNINEGAETGSSRTPQSIIREVVKSGRPIMSADARADERFGTSESVIADNIVSTLCVPLVIRDRIAGAIYIDHRETRHLFSQRDLSFLEAFSDQAAIAIENARLYEELEQARERLSLENDTLRKEVLVEKHLDSIVGHSEAVARTQFTVKKAAASTSTVLLRGESGTGKGLVARIIHNIGARRQGPFIKFNCAALPETLAESELFGYEKGAFTGADRRKLGRFELANGGTIFLDEIGKVSLSIQAKLLRVVEDKEFERVGGTQTIKTDVKIITATNLDLERAIQDGSFREDLYYRLNIVPIMLPPLRDRKDDIPLLSEYFIRKICKDLGVDPKRLEHGILDLFAAYDWPGNIRELEATLHRAIVMANGDVLSRPDFYYLTAEPGSVVPEASLEMLPRDLLNPLVTRLRITAEVFDGVMSRTERQLIEQALDETGGKIRETARRLGLARNTLRAKLIKYNLNVSEK